MDGYPQYVGPSNLFIKTMESQLLLNNQCIFNVFEMISHLDSYD